MKLIYLSLGSNLGDRVMHLKQARELIHRRIGTIESVSGIYESEAWGYTSANTFCNCCLSLRSGVPPLPLMDRLLEIERDMGRKREGSGYSDRNIDIDLLLYGERIVDHPRLIIPHPAMGERRFVLEPLAEIAPELIHPVLGISILQMLQACSDPTEVTPLKSDPL